MFACLLAAPNTPPLSFAVIRCHLSVGRFRLPALTINKQINENKNKNKNKALTAILPPSSLCVDGDSNNSKYTVDITPFPEEDEQENLVHVKLSVDLPGKYPEEKPFIEVANVKGVGRDGLKEIDAVVSEAAADGAGGVVMYDVIEAVRSYLQEHNTPNEDDSMYSQMIRNMKKKEAAEEEGGVTVYEEQVEKKGVTEAEKEEVRITTVSERSE